MKRSQSLFLLAAAALLASLLLVTGCSTEADDDDPPTKVVLAAGSNGTAGNGAITGLEDSTDYLVRRASDGQWGYIEEDDGTVTWGTDIADAITNKEATGSGGSNYGIVGLINDATYDVYLLSGALADENTVESGSGDFDTTGKNAVINLSGLSNTDYVTIVAGAGAVGGTIYVYTNNAAAEAIDEDVENGNASSHAVEGTSLDFSFGTTSQGTPNTKVTAETGDKAFKLAPLTAEFTTIILCSTAD
jgi:hypothetical protein